MSKTAETSRRSFLKSSAVVAAPIAAIGAPAAALGADDSNARLALLEDERAIEALNRNFLRRFNAAGLRDTASLFAGGEPPKLAEGTARLTLDPAAEPEKPQIAEDGARAHCRYACEVETDHPLEGEDTIVQMARLQGNGTARTSERRVIEADYVKGERGWTIEKLRLA